MYKKDLEEYRKGYPSQTEDNEDLCDIYRFYNGEISSQPDGDYIDTMLETWDLDRLESHHGFIQWIFPIREKGLNYFAPVLQRHEISKMLNNPKCMERYTKSYDMMLKFYGIERIDDDGNLRRYNRIWRSRYKNFEFNSHNFLRITRILKSLGEFGYENWKLNLIDHFISELLIGNLKRCKISLCKFWIGTIKEEDERTKREKLVEDKLKRRVLLNKANS